MLKTNTGKDRKAVRTQAKKREILKAASRVFRRHGLQGAGMRQIASEAGMLAGNLYYYFENKQALLAFCQQDTLGGLLELSKTVAASGLTADRKLYLLVLGHILLLNEGTPGSLAHLEIEALEPRWADEIRAQRDFYERAIRSLVTEGIEAKIFRPADAKATTLAILGAVNWTVKWYRPDGRRSARDIGCDFAEFLVHGLLASKAIVQLDPADLAVIDTLIDEQTSGTSTFK